MSNKVDASALSMQRPTSRWSFTLVATVVTLMLVSVLVSGAAATPNRGPEDLDASDLPAEQAASARLAEQHGVTVEREVLEELAEVGETDFFVDFEGDGDLSAAYGIDDWAERGRFVHQRLTEAAEASQAELIARLDAQGVEYEVVLDHELGAGPGR